MMNYGPKRYAAHEESYAMDHEYYSSMQTMPPGHHHNHMKQHVAFNPNRYDPYQNMQQQHHQDGRYSSGHASAGGGGGRLSSYHHDDHTMMMMMMNHGGAGPAAAAAPRRMIRMQCESRDDHKVEWKNL